MEAEISEKLLTKKQVLKILPISARTLARRRWDGSIKALAVNSKFFLYPESAITDFLAKLHSGELQTTTFDSAHRLREKGSSQKRRRARRKPKAVAKAEGSAAKAGRRRRKVSTTKAELAK